MQTAQWLLLPSLLLNILLLLRPPSSCPQHAISPLVQSHAHTHTIRAGRSLSQAPLKPMQQQQAAVAAYDVWGAVRSQAPSSPGRNRALLPMMERWDMGLMLEAMGGFTTGVELGVQNGNFAAKVLANWKSCTKYYLVDIWAEQVNYIDNANVNNKEHEARLAQAKLNVQPYADKIVIVRNLTTVAASIVPGRVDYIYVDARHDYCGVKEDIELWWPKLRPGGIMAGHDYKTAAQVVGQGWGTCADGSVHVGAVVAAVNEFALEHGLVVSITYNEVGGWPTWMVRKPPAIRRKRKGGRTGAAKAGNKGRAA